VVGTAGGSMAKAVQQRGCQERPEVVRCTPSVSCRSRTARVRGGIDLACELSSDLGSHTPHGNGWLARLPVSCEDPILPRLAGAHIEDN